MGKPGVKIKQLLYVLYRAYQEIKRSVTLQTTNRLNIVRMLYVENRWKIFELYK